MLVMPSNDGWMVEYEVGKDPKVRIPQRGWKTVLYTKSKEEAENKVRELEQQGKNARMLQCIF